MAYIACVSFSGAISMAKGQIREIPDSALADDLQKAGYIIPYEATSKETKEEKPVEEKKRRKGK